MKIDHFAVSGMKLEEATEYVESTLGYKMETGGKHKLFGTHNNLLGLKGSKINDIKNVFR